MSITIIHPRSASQVAALGRLLRKLAGRGLTDIELEDAHHAFGISFEHKDLFDGQARPASPGRVVLRPFDPEIGDTWV